MSEQRKDGKFGYQPRKEKSVHPQKGPQNGYQPAESVKTQPPNQGSSIQPAQQKKE